MPKIIENVRELLLDTAQKQIEERGYANTTIRSVAGECGLAVGTVYNYFRSKDMLIATFVVEDWNSYLSDIRGANLSDPQMALHNIYDALIHFPKSTDRFSPTPRRQRFTPRSFPKGIKPCDLRSRRSLPLSAPLKAVISQPNSLPNPS